MESSKSTRTIKKEIFQSKNLMTSIKDPSGNKIRSRKGIVGAATDFYEKLYTSTVSVREEQMASFRNIEVEETPPILMSETRQAIKDLKKRKNSRRRRRNQRMPETRSRHPDRTTNKNIQQYHHRGASTTTMERELHHIIAQKGIQRGTKQLPSNNSNVKHL